MTGGFVGFENDPQTDPFSSSVGLVLSWAESNSKFCVETNLHSTPLHSIHSRTCFLFTDD